MRDNTLAGRVERQRLRGATSTNSGNPAAGARRLHSALRMLEWPSPDADAPAWTRLPALTARVLISLGLAEAEQGHPDQGLGTLTVAESLVAENDRGNLLQQRGLVLERAGRTREALPLLDTAVNLLGGGDQPFALACALLNRSMLHFTVGRVGPARHDLEWCGRLAAEHGFDLIGAKAVHNLGYCDVLEGDIPGALRAFELAARGYEVHGPGCLPTLAMDKARALLAAGLAREAAQELNVAFALFRRDRLHADYAWAELTRAQAALVVGDFRAGRAWAARASRRFRRNGDNAWAAICDLTAVRASLPTATYPARLAGQARMVANRLRQSGLPHDADIGELLSIRAALAAGATADAQRAGMALGRARPRAPLESRLLRHLVRAELAHSRDAGGTALRHLRSGLSLIERHRGWVGSTELRAGVSVLGAEVVDAGLRYALERGSPRLIFAWSERCRAQALRTPPVRPPDDAETRAAVAELRQLTHLARVNELEGRRDPLIGRRCAQLERLIRDKDWQLRGSGLISRPASLATVATALAAADRSMISFTDHDGLLVALVIRGNTLHLRRIGDIHVIRETARRLRRDLDALCGRRLPRQLDGAIRESVRHHAMSLSERILGGLEELLSEHVVIVPTADLLGIPWGILPALRGRPVTVSLSAGMWATAWRMAATIPEREGATVLVAGPHLANAAAEIDQIGTMYPMADRLTGAKATVDETVRALNGARVAHVAAHGHHVMDNVLFSHLDLVDGPLMAYDVHGLKAAPSHVVLSACDVGRAAARTSNEALGFTAALLHAGTNTVISSVARIPDDLAVALMVSYHRAIVGGVSPASALAEASNGEHLIPLVCFGAG